MLSKSLKSKHLATGFTSRIPSTLSLQVSSYSRSYIDTDSRIEGENILKRLLCAVIAVVTTAATANAQEYPKSEISGTYSALITDIHVLNVATFQGYGLNGYGLGFQYNLAKYFGMIAEFTSNSTPGPIEITGKILLPLETRVNVLLFGPRFAYRTKRITAFSHYLIGTARRKVGYETSRVSNTELAMGVGGGLDVNIIKHVAIRVAQFDYVPSHSDLPLNSVSGWFHNLRYQGGVVFKF